MARPRSASGFFQVSRSVDAGTASTHLESCNGRTVVPNSLTGPRDGPPAWCISQLKEVTMAIPSFFGRGDDPFGSLFREVQKTFENFSQRTPFARFNSDALSPKVDIAESKDAIDVTAELPGVDEKDLDVTLTNGLLTVRGEKKTERDEQDKDKNWHVVERSYGSFSRAIPLRSIPTRRKLRRSLIGAYCTSTCRNRQR